MKMRDPHPGQETIPPLIHPTLFSAAGVRDLVASHIRGDARLLVPDPSARGEDAAATHQGARAEAGALHDYLASHRICDLQLAFGASLGGVALFGLLRHQDIRMRHVFFGGPASSGARRPMGLPCARYP